MTAMPPAGPRGETRLARDLGPWSATAVVVGTVIGSGIFRLPRPVAGEAVQRVLGARVWLYSLRTMGKSFRLAAAYSRQCG